MLQAREKVMASLDLESMNSQYNADALPQSY